MMQKWGYTQPTEDHQKQYKYATVIPLGKQHFNAFKEKLAMHNIEGVIFIPFEKVPMKGAAHTAILYHNNEFSQLLYIVANNPQFVFDGKPTLTILITRYIKLKEYNKNKVMSQADVKSIGQWLKQLFPEEELRMWMFLNEINEQEYYIETGSRVSSLYLYIVMTNFSVKSSFNDPKGIGKMSDEERSSRLKMCYSSQ